MKTIILLLAASFILLQSCSSSFYSSKASRKWSLAKSVMTKEDKVREIISLDQAEHHGTDEETKKTVSPSKNNLTKESTSVDHLLVREQDEENSLKDVNLSIQSELQTNQPSPSVELKANDEKEDQAAWAERKGRQSRNFAIIGIIFFIAPITVIIGLIFFGIAYHKSNLALNSPFITESGYRWARFGRVSSLVAFSIVGLILLLFILFVLDALGIINIF
jgi:uncharacterized membrane protein